MSVQVLISVSEAGRKPTAARPSWCLCGSFGGNGTVCHQLGVVYYHQSVRPMPVESKKVIKAKSLRQERAAGVEASSTRSTPLLEKGVILLSSSDETVLTPEAQKETGEGRGRSGVVKGILTQENSSQTVVTQERGSQTIDHSALEATQTSITPEKPQMGTLMCLN